MLDDTWAWRGDAWVHIPVEGERPSPRQNATLRFDPATGEVLLLGGLDERNRALYDVWSLDGAQWRRVPDFRAAPTNRIFPGLGSNAEGAVAAFGGFDGRASISDFWLFEQGAWHEVSLPTVDVDRPRGRSSAVVIEDTDGWLVFGGSDTDFRSRWFDHRDFWRVRP